MPKGLRLADCQKIYFAYKLGTDSNDKVVYSEIQSVMAQKAEVTGSTRYEIYGKSVNYSNTLILPHNKDTQFIDEFTKLWVETLPIDTDTLADYQIMQRGRMVDGLFTLYISKIAEENRPIWFESGGEIYKTDINFNYDTLVGIMPKSKYLPIDEETVIWYRKPVDKNETVAKIRLKDKWLHNDNYVLEFETVVADGN